MGNRLVYIIENDWLQSGWAEQQEPDDCCQHRCVFRADVDAFTRGDDGGDNEHQVL